MIANINRNKNPEVKELEAAQSTQLEHNEEFGQKFQAERQKHDELKNELIQLKETLKRRKELQEETKVGLEVQAEQLKEITDKNKVKQDDCEARVKQVEERRKLNNFEDEKFRRLSKLNTAFNAKLKFIEEKYDYSSQAKSMKLADFKELLDSNTNMNVAIDPFVAKLDIT